MIPYSKQSISQEDIELVCEVLQSDWITQGPWVKRFEQAVADYCGAQYGVAVSSGTTALHLACTALGIGPGDTVWTSPNTFVASANCALYCGATIDFVDIDPVSYNLSVELLETKLQQSAIDKTLPKAVIAVHFGGNPCDMEHISRLADQYGFFVIEDASHALGAELDDHKVGSCRYSDLTIFSFHPIKSITTGEGGMITTNSESLYRLSKQNRHHGIVRHSPPEQDWRYEQHTLGFNYRITDIQAALGYSQLKRLNQFISRRRELADYYRSSLDHPCVVHPVPSANCNSSWHLYVIQLNELRSLTRQGIYKGMRDAGIGVNVHYIPVHTHPYYRQLGFKQGQYPVSEQYYKNALTLPLYPELSFEQIDFISDSLVQLLQ